MKGYDYSRDNLYFVTICVDGMKCCLGNVVKVSSKSHDKQDTASDDDIPHKTMDLNAFGKIVDAQLDWLSDQYEYVVLHSKIVMPNHVHAVIEIDRSRVFGEDIKIKSLSELVGAFKTTSSKLIHRAEFIEFKWKRSFHDHIIRSNRAYKNIVNYIRQNPSKWDKDLFNT
jgi:REP element-mobilizing transposase RayT